MKDISDEGRRFSHTYLRRDTPIADSQRMRRRIAATVEMMPDTDKLTSVLEAELGIPVPYYEWPAFFGKASLHDVLDALTIVYRVLHSREQVGGQRGLCERWIRTMNRVFQEENVHYVMGKNGGVHFALDAEFSHNIASAIAAIQGNRYKNIQAEFSQVQVALDQTPPNGKDAIRKVFTAAEGLFRLMFPDSPRLVTAEARARLSPHLAKVHGSHPTDQRAAEKMLAAFSDWIDAAHFYRHEPGREEIAQPEIGLAINMISIGAAHLRWLAELDAKLSGSS